MKEARRGFRRASFRRSSDRRIVAAWMENGLDLGLVDVVFGYEGDAGILALHLGVLADLFNGGLYPLVPHLKGILNHERVDDTLPKLLLLQKRAVPANQDDLAGFART